MLRLPPFPITRYSVAIVAVTAVVFCLAKAPAGSAPLPESKQQALIEALAEARAEADSLKARLEALQFGRHDAAWTPDTVVGSLDAVAMESLRILDINRELRMVIINGGRREGLRAGMRFILMRDGQETAQVRVIDVRHAVSGAVIEREQSRRSASTSDRPMLLRESW